MSWLHSVIGGSFYLEATQSVYWSFTLYLLDFHIKFLDFPLIKISEGMKYYFSKKGNLSHFVGRIIAVARD